MKDILPGQDGSGPSGLTNVAGRLFFLAYDEVHGHELWTSDGTSEGTVLVRDLAPGRNSLSLRDLTAVNNILLFAAFGENGRAALWRSDGTSAGTPQVQEIVPGNNGPIHYTPADFTVAGSQVFFSGDDGNTGQELWAIPLSQGVQLLLLAPTSVSTSPGDEAFILIRYRNTGVALATGLSLYGDLDAALTYVGDTGEQPPVINGSTLEWDLPEVGFLEERWLGIRVRVPEIEAGARFPVTLRLSASQDGVVQEITANIEVIVAHQIFLPTVEHENQ